MAHQEERRSWPLDVSDDRCQAGGRGIALGDLDPRARVGTLHEVSTRSARPMSWGIPQPAAREETTASMKAADPCRKRRMPPILLGGGSNFKPDRVVLGIAACLNGEL